MNLILYFNNFYNNTTWISAYMQPNFQVSRTEQPKTLLLLYYIYFYQLHCI